MKNIFLILTFCFFNILLGQNHRIFYSFQYSIDSIGSKSEDLMVLLVKNDENVFLSNKFLEVDSVNQVTRHERQYINPQYNSIVQYSKKDKVFTTYKKLDLDYYKFDSKVQHNWIINSEKKNFLGFSLQKATTSYGGRSWEAWFCSDIQVLAGPYLFYGLPGLIFEVYDTEKNFHFSLVRNLNYFSHHFKLEDVFERSPTKIDKNDWAKVQLNYFNNPLYNYKTIGWTLFNKNGSQYTEKDYRELELNIKEGMKRYNNPIELDEKINYK